MRKVTDLEFAADPEGLIGWVEGGETLEITRGGEVIALLVPGQHQPTATGHLKIE